jgi:signal transduction histidine kinase
MMRLISRIGGRTIILALGGLYVALATGRALLQGIAGTGIGIALSNSVLVFLPGFVLIYFGYRLPRANVRSELYPAIASWCLLGAGVMLGVLAFIELRPDGGLERPLYTVQLATALGSVGGLGIGIHDARAKTRAREAERHSRELERQNERLESFAGLLAHELRNPLNIAQIYHQQERPRDEDAAEQVKDALDRIEEMIDVLLVTVRGNDANVDHEPVPVADVAEETWMGVSPEAADLLVETDRTIRADPIHVEHLFKNLFRNSIEHACEAVTVRVGDLPGGFYVEDDGPGIPEDVREDVVEAGFTTKKDGIGLGLTFVSQLAEMYDWECAITESEAGGARFEFTGVEVVTTEEEEEDLQRH